MHFVRTRFIGLALLPRFGQFLGNPWYFLASCYSEPVKICQYLLLCFIFKPQGSFEANKLVDIGGIYALVLAMHKNILFAGYKKMSQQEVLPGGICSLTFDLSLGNNLLKKCSHGPALPILRARWFPFLAECWPGCA